MRAAIDLLMRRANSEETGKYDSAVSVLKAAEKVDKEAVEFFLFETMEPRSYEISSKSPSNIYRTGKNHVEALLESLLDKLEKP